MDKLDLTSPDLTARNIDAIYELFPSVVTETRDDDGTVRRAIDFDLLRQELSDHVVDGPQERYGLTWPGKRKALLAANAPIRKTLRPVREESVDFDTTKNIFIEGDNLEALKLLQESYLGKVKLIYIDPPYNTGNDFIYNDDFAETTAEYLARSGQVDDSGARLRANPETNGRFHSDWLSMMYPRLKLARNLLRNDGFIFVSIDDDEVGNLRKCCDEVFGSINFVANIIWQKKYTRANDAKWFSDTHDHILCYARSKEEGALNLLPRDAKQLAAYVNPDGHPKGPWKATPLHAKSGIDTRPYVFANGTTWSPPSGTFRRFNDSSMRQMESNDEIWFGLDGTQAPSRKSFLAEVKNGVTPVTIWPHDEAGHTHEANSELKSLQLGGVFNNPKPTRLIARIMQLASSTDSLILDFFAGSSTTADAAMQANAEDGGSRACISIQLSEPTPTGSLAAREGFPSIAQISKTRMLRAGERIRETSGSRTIDVGFRVLRVDQSNMVDVLRTPGETSQGQLDMLTDSVKPDRTGEDLLFQVLLDWGLELSVPIARERIDNREVFVVDDGALIACFAENVSSAVVAEIARRQPLRAVFRDSGFDTDAQRINAEQVFTQVSPSTDVKTI